MKKAFVILLLSITFAAGAQEKVEVVDTTITQTEKILSLSDMQEILSTVDDKITIGDFRKFASAIDAVFKKRAAEILEEKKKKFKARK